MENNILFFSHRIVFTLRDKGHVRSWLNRTAAREGCHIGHVNYIFCSDNYLAKLNKQYLDHDTLTDILTFDHRNPGQRLSKTPIEAEVYIGIPRIRQNARELNIAFRDELHRVIVHGLLHLCGYPDKTPKQQAVMRAREDYSLSLRKF